jgi:NADH-quinone oxidoreductase subunit E
MALRDKYASEVAEILARYAQKRSAVLPLLYIAQDEYGHLTDEAVREVAAILELPPTDVFEVVGFYTLLYGGKVGKWVIQVCDDVPCCFLGAEQIVAALEQRLGISATRQTTADGMFTLERVKCVAACNKAPVLQANLEYFYNLTPEQLDGLLTELRQRTSAADYPGISGRFAQR